MCFVFVFGLALCILFDGVVDVVLFCCMFRFCCLVRLYFCRLLHYIVHDTVDYLMFCCLLAYLLVRFLVCQLSSIYVSVHFFLVCFWID